MITLAFGTLPTTSFLSLHASITGSEAREVLDVMRRSLARFGANETLRQMLLAYGFQWSAAPGASDLDLDVAAVAEALGGEAET